MNDKPEPRTLTPMQMFWDGNNSIKKDFRAHPQKIVDDPSEEVRLAEEAMTPVPKDSSVPESVPSQESSGPPEPQSQESPVLEQELPIPSQVVPQSDADSESGKPNESNEDEPVTQKTTTPRRESSSPSSSSETSRGKGTPPVVAKPPTSA